MNKVLFIDTAYIKNYSSFDLNIDDKLIIPAIRDCHDKYLLPVIGSGLMNELIFQVSGNTVSASNRALLENIQPALAAYTVYECADFLLYKFSNKSIEKQSSETTQPISLSELNHLKGKLLDTAQVAMTRLTNYLLANTSTYPLYNSPGSSIDTVYPARTDSYMYGIYTSRKSARCRNINKLD